MEKITIITTLLGNKQIGILTKRRGSINTIKVKIPPAMYLKEVKTILLILEPD